MNTSTVRNDVTSSEYTTTQDADVVPLDKERVNPHYGIDY